MKGLLEKIADVLLGKPQLVDREDPKEKAAELDRRVNEDFERLRAEARGWLRQDPT